MMKEKVILPFCKKSWGWMCLLVLLCVSSCIKDDLSVTAPCTLTEMPVLMTLRFDLPGEVSSRAEGGTRTDLQNIKDLNIFIYRENGYENYYSEGSQIDGGGDGGTVTPGLPSVGQNTELTVKLNKIASGRAKIYVVANYGRKIGEAGDTPEKLKALVVSNGKNDGIPAIFGRDDNYVPMCGFAVLSGSQGGSSDDYIDLSGEEDVHLDVKLKRAVAMVTVGFDGTELNEDVRLRIREIRLMNVPRQVTLWNNCKLQTAEESVRTGAVIDCGQYPDVYADVEKANAISDLDAHYHAEGTPALYMYENAQGDNPKSPWKDEQQTGDYPDKQDQWIKVPATVDADQYQDLPSLNQALENEKQTSYIEVFANYYSNEQAGTVTYRFYLGKDIRQNFDVSRNTHYKVTLALRGKGGINEASWRVETDLKEEGFINDEYLLGLGAYEKHFVLKGDQTGETYEVWADNAHVQVWIWDENSDNYLTSNPDSHSEITIAEGVKDVPFFIGSWPWLVNVLQTNPLQTTVYLKKQGDTEQPIETTFYRYKPIALGSYQGEGESRSYARHIEPFDEDDMLPWGYMGQTVTQDANYTVFPSGILSTSMTARLYELAPQEITAAYWCAMQNRGEGGGGYDKTPNVGGGFRWGLPTVQDCQQIAAYMNDPSKRPTVDGGGEYPEGWRVEKDYYWTCQVKCTYRESNGQDVTLECGNDEAIAYDFLTNRPVKMKRDRLLRVRAIYVDKVD